ncbi:MAG: hypothetical protein IJM08_04210 [Firmicutes bacterium]|nr:hypothetical protein [Bacillota bacterium]
MKCTVIERHLEGEAEGEFSYGLMVEDSNDSFVVHDISVDKEFVSTVARLCELTEPSREKLFQMIEAMIP